MTLGLDAGWTEAEWQRLESAAQEAFAETARLRGVFPTLPASAPSAIEMPSASKGGGTLDDPLSLDYGAPSRPSRLFVDFRVRSHQLGDPTVVERLARMAGRRLGTKENSFFLRGEPMPPEEDRADVIHSLVGCAQVIHTSETVDLSADGAYRKLQKELATAMSEIQEGGYSGPYQVFCSPEVRRLYDIDLSARRESAGLRSLLGTREPIVAELPDKVLVLIVDLGLTPVDIVDASPAELSVVSYVDGGLQLRFEERTLLRVWESKAIFSVKDTPSGG